MKKPVQYLLLLAFICAVSSAGAQKPETWTKDQLMEPAALAARITEKKNVPVLLSVGPGASIPGSVAIGMVNEAEGIGKLRTYLQSMAKDQEVVVYCGCCPFAHCPNVRPALAALKEFQFTRYYLLNIPQNLKKDWIDKGYPVE